MAEIKNAFIKSKMNKDLDARLLPSGEYRDAVNISISKSEGADVGAVENIKGNENVLGNAKIENVDNLDIIGYFMDEKNNYIYIFSTDWDSTEKVSIDANCFIHRFNANNNSSQKIVEGSFLNFSKKSFMTGVNLLENLLFFTDNRNQPRVIDVDRAFLDPSYYSKETDISVAKIAPYKPISILDREDATVAANVVETDTFTINETEKVIKIGDFVSSGQNSLGIVVSYASPTVVVDNNVTLNSGDEVVFSRSGMVNKTQQYLQGDEQDPNAVENPNYDEFWEGDTDFIEDKFIRFAYRYKFNDNTYSLISPYTATMFIPKQFGYFLEGDEEKTYKSSIVAFMENFAQEIKLKIPFPSKDPLNDYKIKELDIIYKESDGISLKVLSTLEVDSILESEYVGDNNEYTFVYESKKPYKTLPGSEVTRVYDKVPVKAQSQEVISNRVVYANYIDRNNSVKSIDYYAVAQEKDYARYDNTAQFPYHTLKQSRTYQLGFVLCDIYGRTSSVILSSKDINAGQLGRGSTLFHNYKISDDNDPIKKPFGDALRVIVEQPITEQASTSSDGQGSGYPGAYADSTGKFWKIEDNTNVSINNNTYTIDKNLTSFLSIGDKLKGKYKDYVEITSISYTNNITTIDTDGQIADYYSEKPNSGQEAITVFGYKINELGWYSYKLVVKQTDQDYYNVYLPGIINGSFDFDNSNAGQSAVTVLINDNINKVPRDLSEVGPQQKKFRSSVRLFGRVTPETSASPGYNKQWYPSASSDNVSEIATFGDFGFTANAATAFDEQSNPLIAKISTIKSGTESIGSLPVENTEGVNYNTFLGVYETVPTETRLELFYETSTTGLISELNKEVANTSVTGATGVVNYSFSLSESASTFPFNCTSAFTFVNAAGTELDQDDIQETPIITEVTNGDGLQVTDNPFSIVQNNPSNPDGTFKIQTTKTFTYIEGSSTANSYTFKIRVNSGGVISNIFLEGALTNSELTLGIVDDPIQITTNDVIVLPLQTPGREVFKNGTSISSEVTEDLIYSITNQSKQEPLTEPTTAFSISANQLVVNDRETSTDEYYTVTIRAEDANGLDGSRSIDRTFNIAVGAVPINYDINDDNGYNFGFGPGCRETELDPDVYTYQSAVAFIFGAVGAGDSQQIPDNVLLNDGALVISREQNQGLTNGTLRFKLFTPYECNNGYWRADHKVWVQYRKNNTTPWLDAKADGESDPWPDGGRFIYLNQLSPTGFIGDFSTPGEYRVIINPEIGYNADSPCNDNESNGCYSPFYECQLRYCDAVYNDC